MKNNFGKSIILFAFIALLASCRNKEADKRIAELESQPMTKKSDSTFAPSSAMDEKPEGPLPVMEFTTKDHDFGTINEGDVVEYTYEFKNTGEAPLIIQGAQGSCGCTVPDWSKQPVAVGETGYVKAKFDSHGKRDLQNKTVTVTANTFPKQTELRFKAVVKAKDAK